MPTPHSCMPCIERSHPLIADSVASLSSILVEQKFLHLVRHSEVDFGLETAQMFDGKGERALRSLGFTMSLQSREAFRFFPSASLNSSIC